MESIGCKSGLLTFETSYRGCTVYESFNNPTDFRPIQHQRYDVLGLCALAGTKMCSQRVPGQTLPPPGKRWAH